jgi:preprotein translocase SecE subunit
VSLFRPYKPGQAKLSRTIALLSGLFLIFWGARSLMRAIPTFWPSAGDSLNQLMEGASDREAWRVNAVLFDEKLSPAFLAAALIIVLGSFWWWRFLNRERWADLLIDMEQELRKVSWPTLSDAWQSTLVVTGFTVVIVVTILVYDVVINRFIQLFVEPAP